MKVNYLTADGVINEINPKLGGIENFLVNDQVKDADRSL